ncbi:MAG TPA: 3D domain-containing protein [Acetivibrio sp.]|uniref:3D domain-containing protein n=1 Tax=Acetivibrio sp. TaxID=1872092 RepID=UPI002BFB0175|nr:3D domain-containing protein [Acetivibrio sp.]HOM01541.1 3D domain-containing protein [Acetivibrio sp.]
MGNAVGNIFNCPDLNRVQSFSKEYLSEYFQDEEIKNLNYPEVLEEILMNATSLKLNYPEILDEILRKVDSAVLSSKSASLLDRVKDCSQSLLSKKDLDLKVVAAGSIMTFFLTCAGTNIANSIAEKAATNVKSLASSTWISPGSTKLSSLGSETVSCKAEAISMPVSSISAANIPLAEIKRDITDKNPSKTQSTLVSRSKVTKSVSATEVKTAASNVTRTKVEVADIMPQCKRIINMTATAYDLSYKSCGKTREHPLYGITASGARATVGRTIAVDPSVIPLGTRVYISFPVAYSHLDGIYIAEDTGSLIKGNKIDVFFGEDKPGETIIYNKAMKFGLQEVVVYVLD